MPMHGWVNNVVVPPAPPSPPLDFVPVFVVGVPRSGTTWVQRILASHPEAWMLLETYVFSSEIGLGALLKRVPGAEGPEAGLAPPGLGRLFQRAELVAELRALVARWIRGGIGEGPRFAIEKSPWHLHEVPLIAEVFPEARFVNVVRDGRDVAVSFVSARRSWSQAGEGEPKAVLREAAAAWRTGMSLGREAQMALGTTLLEIRYEEVAADPRAAYRRLFDHCGMPYDDSLLERTFEQTDFDLLNEERGEGRALRRGRVGEWRERLGLADALAFHRLAGETLFESDYERDPRWWLRRPLRSRL